MTATSNSACDPNVQRRYGYNGAYSLSTVRYEIFPGKDAGNPSKSPTNTNASETEDFETLNLKLSETSPLKQVEFKFPQSLDAPIPPVRSKRKGIKKATPPKIEDEDTCDGKCKGEYHRI